ncbi:ubiquitin carboxyl-terminal hydrolase 21 isoform X3 [Syngnathus acus]|uniref:ubiquitin carboxyl-terminal hydrolase 21 isoform X3 n=1 Tax=Syngnathus acus TaxID=161584 RepID=UPI001885B348|nr:ubiquitin carboxyl-terminal hydrolase 21 isoform X3 [Syngnathus acus]
MFLERNSPVFVSYSRPAGLLPPKVLQTGQILQGGAKTHRSFLSSIVWTLGFKRRGHRCESTTVLQYFPRCCALFQWLQQDAQEFLRFLLEKLHSEINRKPYIQRPLKDPEQKYARFRISEEAAATWKKHLENDDSKIVDLFSGQLRSSLHCSVCSHYSNTFDVFCDLSLPIPKHCTSGNVTLKECLDYFSQEERLDKENSPMCERCNRHTESTKRLSIQRFPHIIVIHLNRFTTTRWSISKSTTYVSFPLTNLDLGPYGPVDCEAVLYDLYAICNHVGTVNMGHYIACCSDENGWCYYNDSSVSAVSETQLQTNQAYVLFYQRNNITTRK